METQKLENTAEVSAAAALLSQVEEKLKAEEARLAEMDKGEVKKDEYENIKRQAKLVQFLTKVREPLVFYAEAEENNDPELLKTIKETFLNISEAGLKENPPAE